MNEEMKVEKGQFVEVAGKLIGVVEEIIDEQTLLIRQVRIVNYVVGDPKEVCGTSKAAFVNKNTLNNYWTKLLPASEYSISKSFNIINSNDLIREFPNV